MHCLNTVKSQLLLYRYITNQRAKPATKPITAIKEAALPATFMPALLLVDVELEAGALPVEDCEAGPAGAELVDPAPAEAPAEPVDTAPAELDPLAAGVPGALAPVAPGAAAELEPEAVALPVPMAACWKAANVLSAVGLTAKTIPFWQWFLGVVCWQ
jgi:hypothetical protein